MYGDEKSSKVSVYVKVSSTKVPGAIDGVQFGFGQTCGALNGFADSDGTDNCPFFEDFTVPPLVVEKVVVCTSTRFPPWLVQLMVAEYDALRSTSAFV
jgi:hypothetical protein